MVPKHFPALPLVNESWRRGRALGTEEGQLMRSGEFGYAAGETS